MQEVLAELESRLEALTKRMEEARVTTERYVVQQRWVDDDGQMLAEHYAYNDDPPYTPDHLLAKGVAYTLQQRRYTGAAVNDNLLDNPYVDVYSVSPSGERQEAHSVAKQIDNDPETEAILQDAETFGYVDMQLGDKSEDDERFLTVEGLEALYAIIKIALTPDEAAAMIGPRGYIASHMTREQRQYLKDHPNRVVRTR